MQKLFLYIAAVQGALAVTIGAFGAHALKNHLTAIGRADVFETAVKYQFYHTFALLAVGILQLLRYNRFLNYSGYSFVIGSVIFSGSLYILCMTNVAKWGAVTPIGGLALVAGWVLFAIGIGQMK